MEGQTISICSACKQDAPALSPLCAPLGAAGRPWAPAFLVTTFNNVNISSVYPVSSVSLPWQTLVSVARGQGN